MCSFYPLSSPFWSLSRDSWCIFLLQCRVKVHFKSQAVGRQSDQAFCVSSKAFVLVLSNPYFVLCFASCDIFSQFSVQWVSGVTTGWVICQCFAQLKSYAAFLLWKSTFLKWHHCFSSPATNWWTTNILHSQYWFYQESLHQAFTPGLVFFCISGAAKRKATLMYALSESNMPADVPSDCVSLHSSLILKVILGRFCSDYSSGRANSQPWAIIHLWGTSAGNNTKAPGTQHLIKIASSSVCFLWLFVVVHANKTDWTENKWWHCSFPVFLSQPLNEQKRTGQKKQCQIIHQMFSRSKKKALGECWRRYYTSSKKKDKCCGCS